MTTLWVIYWVVQHTRLAFPSALLATEPVQSSAHTHLPRIPSPLLPAVWAGIPAVPVGSVKNGSDKLSDSCKLSDSAKTASEA